MTPGAPPLTDKDLPGIPPGEGEDDGSGQTPPDLSGKDAPDIQDGIPDGDDPGDGDDGDDGDGNDDGSNDDGGKDDGDRDDDDPDIIIYCPHCHCAWWDCMWCHYWTPFWWRYHGYGYGYWENYWNPRWHTVFVEYHDYYDFENYYPSIYTPPAIMVDPESESLEYLDEGASLFRQGNYLEALHMFRLATLTDLNFAIPKFAYAHALFALGIYEYAAYEIRLGLYLMPEWPELGGDLKLMYGNPEDFEQQLAALLAHLKVWSNDEDALLVLGYVSYFTGDLNSAEEAFEKIRNSTSEDTAYSAGLFLELIASIKEDLASEAAGVTQPGR